MARDTRRTARRLAGALLLLVALAPVPARADAMRDCVEQGGTYFDDGHCETEGGRDDARKACLRQGGRFLSNGQCEIHRDPVAACKEAGGDGMTDGHCWRVVRPGDRP
jgi:hypothetical protein